MEEDLDYQILRKTFALDRRSVVAGAMASSEHARHLSASGMFHERTEIAAADSANVGQRLELSFQRAFSSVERLEISTTSGASGWSVQTERLQQASVRLDVSLSAEVQTGDPLVLDLSGTGIQTTGLGAGVSFDLDGDGVNEHMSSVSGDTWFLALDRDANGQIDNGRELFGDQNGSAHGFAELARYDENSDGLIDASDAVFSELKLMRIGADGTQVVKTLEQADVAALEVNYQNTRKALNLYDSVAQVGRFHRADGSTGQAGDVLLGYSKMA